MKLFKANILLLLVISLVIFACSDGSNERKLTLSLSLEGKDVVDRLSGIIAEFEKANKCKVSILISKPGDDCRDIIAGVVDGKYDVCLVNSLDVPSLNSSGAIVPFGLGEITKDKPLDNVSKNISAGGKFYAAPWLLDTDLLFINKKLLKSADSEVITFDELEELADAANNPPEKYGFGLPVGGSVDCTDRLVSYLVCFDNQLKLPEYAKPPTLNAAERYLSLGRSGIFETQASIEHMFLQGKVAAFIAGCGFLYRIDGNNPNLRAVLYPGLNDKSGASLLRVKSFVVSKKSSDLVLSKKLISLLLDNDITLTILGSTTANGLPALQSAQLKFVNNTPKYLIAAEQARISLEPEMTCSWCEAQRVIHEAFVEGVFARKSVWESLKEASLTLSNDKARKKW